MLPLVLAVFFGWYSLRNFPVDEIIPYFVSANYIYIFWGVFFGLLSHLSRAYRWQYLLQPMGYSIKLPNSIMAVFVAYLANYGIPRSGEVLRAAVATNYESIPFEKGFGTIVAERLADMAVMLVIIGLTLTFQYQFIYDLLLKDLNPLKLVLYIVLAILIVILLIFWVKKSSSKVAVKVKGFFSGLVEGILSIFRLEYKVAFIFHTLFIWAMYVGMFYVTTFAFEELQPMQIAAVLVAFIAASFTIAATNGGIFFYPAAVLAAFSLFGYPEDASYAFGWIMWTSQTLLIIIGGCLSFVFLPLYNKCKAKKSTI